MALAGPVPLLAAVGRDRDAPGPTPTRRPSGATYAPEADGEPDPGEVVWAWVPYEDDPSQGKDRPVLVLEERDGGWTGLMLSSQDHDRDAADEARLGRYWMDVGTGGWDSAAAARARSGWTGASGWSATPYAARAPRSTPASSPPWSPRQPEHRGQPRAPRPAAH